MATYPVRPDLPLPSRRTDGADLRLTTSTRVTITLQHMCPCCRATPTPTAPSGFGRMLASFVTRRSSVSTPRAQLLVAATTFTCSQVQSHIRAVATELREVLSAKHFPWASDRCKQCNGFCGASPQRCWNRSATNGVRFSTPRIQCSHLPESRPVDTGSCSGSRLRTSAWDRVTRCGASKSTKSLLCRLTSWVFRS